MFKGEAEVVKVGGREVMVEPYYVKVSWVNFIDILIKSKSVYEAIGRYEEVEGKKNLESTVVGWFSLDEFRWEVEKRFELAGFDKSEVLNILRKDIVGKERIDDGKRASIGLYAKISGWLNDGSGNVMIGQSFKIMQSDGKE